MTKTNNNEDLESRIERVIAGYFAESRKAAQEAIERAFASAKKKVPAIVPQRRKTSGGRNRREPSEVAALGERFYLALCEKPGETMMVLSAEVGVSANELYKSVRMLRGAGRVRAVGKCNRTRYFPMTERATAAE
jgi:hypothetical protein